MILDTDFKIHLRALEPEDIDRLYQWENDPEIWRISNTLAPFSRHTLQRFIEEQRFDVFQTRQQRLIIHKGEKVVGCVDLFDIEPLHRRAGVGILIYPQSEQGKGYAKETLTVLEDYARQTLGLHQLWANVGEDNPRSLSLFLGCGYLEVGRKKDWNWTVDGFKDEIILQKILPSGK